MRQVLVSIVVLVVATSLFGACDTYIKLSGINGELGAPCQGAIDFISAKTMGNTLTIVKHLDKASVALYAACVNGTPINDATITVAPPQNKTFHFKNLLVSSVAHSANETVTLSYGAMDSPRDPATPAGAAAPRGDLNIMGSARPSSFTAVFIAGDGSVRNASGWQTSVRGGAASTTLLLTPLTTVAGMVPAGRGGATPSASQSSQNCVELRVGAGAAVRYVFQGDVPPQGGNLHITRMQIQIPAGPNCGWMPGQPTFNLR
jgi:hypothetical protein